MPYADAGDTRVHYETQGKGAPLLMLMGFGAAGDMWGPDFLNALAPSFRLLLPDNRGAGTTARGTAPYTIERLALDAIAVLDAEGILAAHVLGVSMGGMIAQKIAASHPSRVRGLVLGCTTTGGAAALPPRRSTLEDIQRRGLLALSSTLVTPAFLARRTGLLSRLAVRAMARPMPSSVMAEQFGALTRFDMTDRLGDILAPTLVVTGDCDALVPPENSRLLARGIRGAHGVIVKGAGHCFFWEAPERASAAITDFLKPLSTVAIARA